MGPDDQRTRPADAGLSDPQAHAPGRGGQAAGRARLHLNIGQPDLETPALHARAPARRADKVLAYTPSGGTPEYLAAPAAVLPAPGDRARAGRAHRHHRRQRGDAVRALRLRRRGRRGAAGRALLHELQRLRDHGRASASCPLPTRGEDGFHLPPRAVWESALTPRTKLVLLCNPNNPTGTVYTRDELDDGRRALPRPRPLPGLRRGLPRVRLRRPRSRSRRLTPRRASRSRS